MIPWKNMLHRDFAVRGGLILSLVLSIGPMTRNSHGEPTSRRSATNDEARAARSKSSGNKAKSESGNGSASGPEARQQAEKALRDGRYETVRSMISAAIRGTRSTSVRDSWRILEARLEYALDHPARSGLIAMEIVILRPESEQAGAALFHAGRAFEKLNRPAKASELYQQCLVHKTTSAGLRRRAEKRIAALAAAVKQP